MSYVYVVYKAMNWMACRVDPSVPMEVRDVVMHEGSRICFNQEEIASILGTEEFTILRWVKADKCNCTYCLGWAIPCPGCWNEADSCS